MCSSYVIVHDRMGSMTTQDALGIVLSSALMRCLNTGAGTMFSDEINAFENVLEIEFLGGPLDGHVEFFNPPLPMAVCFKSDALLKPTPWLRRLTKLFTGKFSQPFHVAIYDLTLQQEQLVYRFAESIVASEPKRLAGKVWLGVDCSGSHQDLSNFE